MTGFFAREMTVVLAAVALPLLMSKDGGATWISVGEFGVVHPDVLQKERYDIDFPCSLLEMNLELVAGGLGTNPMLSAPFRSV